LLLEDNPTDVFVIKEFVIQAVLDSCNLNLQVRIAEDGREALQYLQNLDQDDSSPGPALVLLDLNVPKVDGLEVLRHMRHGSRCKRTPVIVVTSSNAEPDRTAAQRLGVEAYFQKPKDLTAYMELAQVIKRVLLVPEEAAGRQG
jgi:CheY-like chemotaxis protein